MLHEFPVVFDQSSGRPSQKGQCRILLGDRNEAQQIRNGLDLTAGGDKVGLALNWFGTGLSCLGMGVTSAKMAATLIAGGYATAATGGAAAPIVIPPLFADGLALTSSTFFCTTKVGNIPGSIRKYQARENQKVLANALSKASDIASKDLIASPQTFARYNQLRRNASTINVSAAIWNKLFVRVFNKRVHGTFENGWGHGTKFFDAVESIQTEVLTGSTTYRD